MAGCAPGPPLIIQPTRPPATFAGTPLPAPPPPSLTPGVLVPLPGMAARLPAVPAGVPFTGELLIADRGHSRLLLVDAEGRVRWQFPGAGTPLSPPLGSPDDSFVTPEGRTIVANAEVDQTVSAISLATGRIVWQVGHYDTRGRAPGYFSEPDDAVPFPDGTIWVADIRNCRLVHLSAAGGWLGVRGNGVCRHQPPLSFDMPNGSFPAPDGSAVITEIGGSWVTWINPDGSVRWSVRSPALYPSDAVPLPDGSVLLTDYSDPGAVYRIDGTGKVLWSYRPTGAGRLDHPSIALPLAANRIAICDDWGDQILVVDPTTDRVVWSYQGVGALQLSTPDGLDYLPPAAVSALSLPR